LKPEFKHIVSTNQAADAAPALPDDLARLAAVWEKIPAAVRQTWLATAEALAGKGQA
jgi:hypothetical protein